MLPTYCTLFFIQECNLLFPIPKKNVIFNIFHLLVQNQYFFLVNFSNLNNNCTLRITVLIPLSIHNRPT